MPKDANAPKSKKICKLKVTLESFNSNQVENASFMVNSTF